MESYKPYELVYKSSNSNNGFAVFSEIFYPEGWTASIDGQEKEIKRVNWVLRGLEIPAGDHEIKFYFKPSSYYTGNQIGLAGSIMIYLLLAGAIFVEFKNKKSNGEEDPGAGAAS